MTKRVAVLGSTGSIGTQALDVMAQLPEFRVVGISAGRNAKLLQRQIEQVRPEMAVISDKSLLSTLDGDGRTLVRSGESSLCDLACHPHVDLVLVAVVGAVGLAPTLAALEAGKQVLLANKETLVAGGHLVAKYRNQLIPVDSEHSAIWQCLGTRTGRTDEVQELILTASGGPFFKFSGDLSKVTVEQALNHPNWVMGGKITVDSATLMNKGLEVIEAHWLFDIPYSKISVVVHPESIVHSLVRFADGSLLGQLATTDMRLPIQLALTHPHIRASKVPPLDLTAVGPLHFSPPDYQRFPCLGLAYDAGRTGGTTPTALNAANEVAVEAFISGQIPFTAIGELNRAVCARHCSVATPALEDILAADADARRMGREWIDKRKGG